MIVVLATLFVYTVFIKKTSAALIDQSQTEQNGYYDDAGNGSYTDYDQQFVAGEPTLTGFVLYGCRDGADPDNIPFSLRNSDGTLIDSGLLSDTAAANIIPTCAEGPEEFFINKTSSTIWATPWSLATSTLTVGGVYRLRVEINDDTTYRHLHYYKTNTNPYSLGYVMQSHPDNTFPDDDLYFKTIYSSQGGDYQTEQDRISVAWPPTTIPPYSVSVSSTPQAVVYYQLQTADTGTIKLHFNMTSGGFSFDSTPLTINKTDGFASTTISMPAGTTYSTFTGGNALRAVGFWTVEANLSDLAYANTLYSVSYGGYSAPSSTPGPTSTSTALVLSCDQNSGVWDRSWCNLFQWLFKPSIEIMTLWTGLKNDVENKPPFGYFTQISAAWTTNLSTSSTPTFTIAGTTELSVILSPLRTGITLILWITFGAWIFWRFKHFEF